ncbi:MAG: glycosyltransferase [Marinicaulis sp.]|nr:glycosyltransferase [Marinicaulis sp.]
MQIDRVSPIPMCMMLTFIAILSFLAWGYLFAIRDGFWRANIFLGNAPSPEKWPSVTIIVPARNEAENIAKSLEAHLHCDYPGDFAVRIIDDQSTDGTGGIADRITGPKEQKAEIIAGAAPPAGWSGKLWALQQGVSAAGSPNYFLFADADIVLARSALRRLVAKAEHENLALTSLMAKLDARGWGAFLVPAFIYFFQKIYPFAASNDPNDSRAAAAGGCVLVRREDLDAIGGFEKICGAMIDDCTLAQEIKDRTPSTKIWLGLAQEEAVSLRDNRSLSSIWNMVARTAFAQLNYSNLILVGAALGMAVAYLAPPLIALTFFHHWNTTAEFFALCAWAMMAFTYLPTLKLYDRPPWEAAALPGAAALFMAMTVSSALRYNSGRGGEWKGRADPMHKINQGGAGGGGHPRTP